MSFVREFFATSGRCLALAAEIPNEPFFHRKEREERKGSPGASQPFAFFASL
jgi:hypothetical protein